MDDAFPRFLLSLLLILGLAHLLGRLARQVGQPAVLGELVAGVLLGPSVLGQLAGIGPAHIDPHNETLRLLAELGVVLLLFLIGLETDLGKLLAVGGASAAVAVVGVVLPFALGYLACLLLAADGPQPHLVAIVAGATLTATSVGITARVLAELGRLQDRESQVILGAAVLDDVLGLVLLAVVAARLGGEQVPPARVARIALVAFGFLAGALALGRLARPLITRVFGRLEQRRTVPLVALLFGLALAYTADRVQPGLALVGAFAGGLLLAGLPQTEKIESGLASVGHVLIPIFFAVTGAAVDVRLLNPLEPANRPVLLLGAVLLVVAVGGKWAAGYAPFWLTANKTVIGIGMVPRGEVGLIFVNLGRPVLGAGLYSALTLVVVLSSFLAPPALQWLLHKGPGPVRPTRARGVQQVTTEP